VSLYLGAPPGRYTAPRQWLLTRGYRATSRPNSWVRGVWSNSGTATPRLRVSGTRTVSSRRGISCTIRRVTSRSRFREDRCRRLSRRSGERNGSARRPAKSFEPQWKVSGHTSAPTASIRSSRSSSITSRATPGGCTPVRSSAVASASSGILSSWEMTRQRAECSCVYARLSARALARLKSDRRRIR
jgi:hypothetical protein